MASGRGGLVGRLGAHKSAEMPMVSHEQPRVHDIQCRAEEERQRQLEAERRAREAEAARLAAEARAAKEAERRALAKLARRFAVRLEGAASIAKPPPVRLAALPSGC